MKFLLHIDMNAFFASVEENIDPSIKNKPVAVCGKTKRSVVSSCNYIARSFGVKAAMPIYMALKLCKNLILVDHHFDQYKKYSNLFIKTICEKLTNKIEIMSIDECFADITSLCKNPKDAYNCALKIQKEIFNAINIQTSIGVSYNKFLAKMASDIKKPMGITSIFSQDDIENLIWNQPIKNMFLIGESSTKELKKYNINLIKDLTYQKNIPILKKILHKNWQLHYQHALGIGNDELDYSHNKPKSISCSSTFLNDTNDLEEISYMLKNLSLEVFERLKEEELKGKTINVTVKFADFSSTIKSLTLKEYISTYEEIIFNASKIYEENFIGKTIRLIGVGISNLISTNSVINSMLFDDYKPPQKVKDNLKDLTAQINDELGIDILKIGTELLKK